MVTDFPSRADFFDVSRVSRLYFLDLDHGEGAYWLEDFADGGFGGRRRFFFVRFGI